MKVRTLLFVGLAAFTLICSSCSKEEEEKQVNSFAVSAVDGLVQITPTTNDAYVWAVLKSADVANLTDAEVINKVVEKYGDNVKDYTVTGAVKNDCLLDIELGVPYVALAFGYENGAATTGLTKTEFTLGGDDTVVLEGLTDINQADFWGDKKGTVNGKWVLAVTSTDYMKYLNLELASPLEQSANPVGTYELADPYGAVGTALPGYQDGSNFEGCTYLDFSSLPAEGLFFKTGRIVIKDIDSETYVLRMFVRDGEGKEYYLDYEGGMYITDKTLGFQ